MSKTEQMPLASYVEQAYLNYSMYVILDRALPHLADGLKPVQRRILYAMAELGLRADAKYKKSARAIGDVIGKFHPHGDSAAYEAMVLMAQSFSFRYPLVDGQGNWGSIDNPKSYAAMRYTECRLTDYSALLLGEIDQGTVDWEQNFDGTMEEPLRLPAQVPNLLLNGTTGIAVGMATDIPPHNLTEVLKATIYLLQNPKATTVELCKLLPAPDFPSGAEITTSQDKLLQMYETGLGKVRQRATYSAKANEIVIDALPYRVTSTRVLEQIAEQMQAKKLPMLMDLRDESDREHPTRLVLVMRSNRVNADELMSHIFATTSLEVEHRVNMNLIGLNGRPQVLGLREQLTQWLKFRTDTVRQRLEMRLDKAVDRLHILDGLMVAFLNLDEVIEIVRNADDPKKSLMKRFDLSATQASAILEIRLRQLAKLEQIKIEQEQQELKKEREELEAILGSSRRMKTLIRNELEAVLEEHGDERLCALQQRDESVKFSADSLVSSETVMVVLSNQGWIRQARGSEVRPAELSYRTGDGYKAHALGRMNQQIAVLDSAGRSYSLAVHKLPSARGHGEPVSSLINAPSGVLFAGLCCGADAQQVLMASSYGYGFVAPVAALHSRSKSGKQTLRVHEDAEVLAPVAIPDDDSEDLLGGNLIVAVASKQGRLLLFPLSELPTMNSGRGIKLIQITPQNLAAGDDKVVATTVLRPDQTLRVHLENRDRLVQPQEFDYYLSKRGLRGQLLPRSYRDVIGLSTETK